MSLSGEGPGWGWGAILSIPALGEALEIDPRGTVVL